jgi:hypothetical protein
MKALSIHKAAFVLLAGIMFYGCKPSEGPGGTSTIKGKVLLNDYSSDWLTYRETTPKADEKVHIIYGEGKTTPDDDVDTGPDGSYEFKYLQKGTYQIYVYSKDSTGANTPPTLQATFKKKLVITTVEITENHSTVEAPDLMMLDNNFP